ncbi:2-oxo-4-hydroxy-4-carboxy-5-ureidoimidazoline decarboxylase [Saccharomonospora cyanea]|uniref:2-oxo-4-hydroxy-4-carboxy-5-ureidoimidazoline decarboxylase n=1 Tax=Saccharomonospora cyanea NA-134 TaxID=882082 RepID=H5XF56_9PSEU|nr:2-oxo-4-hydroxy-4-carboxy-5-ureidoimidazoline decarboxylase [Saccharomonospora cyanea]EHR61466.1 OHCU decarboxylase [Saccharomonospora cyanea NA-134]
MTLEEFNAATGERLMAALLACCDAPRWAETVSAGRPYPDADALVAAADKAAASLEAHEIDRALAAHPRIGERAEGSNVESAWSRQEQSTVRRDHATQQALVEGNRAYEEKFGRVFLICATGLSAERILAALRTRLGNDPEREAEVVADELRKIAALRVRKLVTAA